MTLSDPQFPPSLLPHPAAIAPLDERGLIRAQGPEAMGFLQGQLTNDVQLLAGSRAQLTGYCNPKGRLLAVFTAFALGADDIALSLPRGLLPATLKRLRLFVLRSKLQLTDASANWPAIGLIGAGAADALQGCGLPAPAQDWETQQQEGLHLLRRPGPVPRFELCAAPDRLRDLLSRLALPAAPASAWPLAEVLSGLPQVTAETTEHFVPQTIDLDHGGVSFTKGCYPGQEIVARVHYLGRVKQRLFWADADAALAPGTSLKVADGDQSVGEVMASATLPSGGACLAISLQLDHAHSEGLAGVGGASPALRKLRRVHPES